MNSNTVKVNVGDKVSLKSAWSPYIRYEVLGFGDNGKVMVKHEHEKDYNHTLVEADDIIGVLPKWDFFPHNFVPFEEKRWRARLNFYMVERALDNLRHEFAMDVFKPGYMGIWQVWGVKAVNEIKKDGRTGLFNYLRNFAKFVIENVRKEEELEAFLAHNMKHVKGYSVEEFNKELKREIISNVRGSFKWDGCASYEVFGNVKRAYGDWDEFFVILKEAFEDYLNENF